MLRTFLSKRNLIAPLLGLCVMTAPALVMAQTHPAPGDASTPKAALRLADHTVPDGGLEAALRFYYAATDRERELARCSAQVDLACSFLEQAVVEKFGRQAADDAIHALGAKVGSDIDQAREKIDGNQAVVEFKGDDEPLHMTKEHGSWKVDVAAEVGERKEDDVKEQEEWLKHMAVSADRLADQVASGKLATAQQVTDACKDERGKLVDAGK